jgi:hypothetical protein
MTDADDDDLWGYGYPETRDYRDDDGYLDDDYPCACPRAYRPFPYFDLDQEEVPGFIVLIYALFTTLYGFGLVSFLPRTGWHNALLAAAFVPTCIVCWLWPLTEHIPHAGRLIYLLPALALPLAPFALDFYLMYGR